MVGAGLVRLDGEPLCRVTAEGKLLAVDSEGRATGLQYRDPGLPLPKWRHLGELVRFLREDAELLRRDLAAAVGVATETVRNLETGRHSTNSWSWAKLLSHPALADLPRLATESGLAIPKGIAVPAADATLARGPGRGGSEAP